MAALLHGTRIELHLLSHIREVEQWPSSQMALDMPIGLPETASWAGRACDREARALLGARRASIFPPPSRALLQARDFSELKGSGLSLQAFNLFPKIREVDEFITPELQERIRETHPELVFARLAGAPMRHSKKKPEGIEERRSCLPVKMPQAKPKGCNWDDVYDAIALAVAARDGFIVLPSGETQRDARDLRMEICY